MLRTCGDYVEDMLIFAQCSINIRSNHGLCTSTENGYNSVIFHVILCTKMA